MRKIIIIITVLLFGATLFLNCDSVKKSKPRAWVEALDENDITLLSKPIREIRKHFDTAQQLQKKGQKNKADVEMKLARQGLEQLESYYVPLMNAKLRLATAFKQVERNEIANATEKVNQVTADLFIAGEKAPADVKKELQSLISDLEAFEKEYISKLLAQNQWHRTKTAAMLCIPERTLYRKLKQFQLTSS